MNAWSSGAGNPSGTPVGRRAKRRLLVLLVLAVGVLSLAFQGVSFSARAGQPVVVSGTYVEVHGDNRLSDETRSFVLRNGQYFELHGKSHLPIRSQTPVVVRGAQNGRSIDISGGSVEATGPAVVAATTGSKRLLVINVVYPGAGLTASTAQEQNFLFGTDSRSLNSYYKETSYGQLSWTGDLTPRYTVADPGTSCDLYGLSSSAEAAAVTGGYTPSSYDAIMINAPALHCASVGYGEIGGKHTWIENGLYNLGDGYARLVPTHEIGHSLGLYHSHGLECGSTTVDSQCLASPSSHNEEYGNAWDVMGNNWPGDSHDGVTWFSAKQEMLLGWISGAQVRAVTTSGTYSLVPLERAGATTAQVLTLSTPTRRYYLEYRQPIGQDAFLSQYPAATDSLHISVADPTTADTGPYALDFTPHVNSVGVYDDWFDAPLRTGQSFTDPENTFTVTAASQNGTTASVSVAFKATSTVALTVTKSGTGAGTVTSSPAGVNCGTSCSASFPTGSSVTLTAAPSTGSTFAGWGGACTGSATVCTLSMTAARAVTASFTGTPSGVRSEESAAQFEGWFVWRDATANGGSWRSSAVTNNTAKFAFSGTGVTWVSNRGPARGIASVTIDGAAKGTVDLYSATPATYSKTFTGLSSGSHTIVIKVTGTKNAASSSASVVVDAFTVGTAVTQESANKITYNTWKGATSASASGGNYRSSPTAGAKAQLTFTGTSVDWITTTGPGWGRAKVLIDGVDKGTVDLYATTARWQTVKTYGGLSAGSHTIVVQVLGTKNAAATSTNVAVDAFVVR